MNGLWVPSTPSSQYHVRIGRVALVSSHMLLAGVCTMLGLGCCCGAMLEQEQTVEVVVRYFLCSFMEEW